MNIRTVGLAGIVATALSFAPGCTIDGEQQQATATMTHESSRGDSDEFRAERESMVATQLRSRDISDPRVLDVMRRVPRHRFVPAEERTLSYVDGPLPIGYGQTISQPYIVAYMTQAMELEPTDRVLEIGTGSGYQAAVLAGLVSEVYTIEIVPQLADRAKATLESLGYSNVFVRSGDGYRGWPDKAPFDAIIVTAAPEHIPKPLVEQLKVGGKLVIPVGAWEQDMVIVTKTEKGALERHTIGVRFVPMTGEARERP